MTLIKMALSSRHGGRNKVYNLHVDTLDLILSGNKYEVSKQEVKDHFHLCHGELHTHASLSTGQDLSLVMWCRKAYSRPS